MGMKESWDNFFTSGHTFTESEYEEKTKYFLLNFTAFTTIIALIVLIIIELKEGMFALINLLIIGMAILTILLLRVNRKYYLLAANMLLFTAMAVLTTWLIVDPKVYLRVLWFFFFIAFAFLAMGKKAGFTVFAISMVEVIVYFTYFNNDLSRHTTVLILILLILLSVIIGLYEHREASIKKRLYDLNSSLEEKIRAKTENLLEQKNTYEELAHYDTLTELPNRLLFKERLNHAIEKAKRHKSKLAVLFIDVDHFKDINDLFGHPIGDQVLRLTAERIRKSLRSSDTLARLGGDEFALILEDLKNESSAGAMAEHLRRIAAEPLHVDGHELFVTLSIGISLYPKDSDEANELVKCADTAMYSAKKDGRNLVHFYNVSMTDRLLEQLMMEADIRRGIENGEFVVHYQPQMDARRGIWTGMEALIRWNHPTKGPISPREFIPVAETSSLIVSLGGIVLKQVTEDMKYWNTLGFRPERISVNLSVRQLTYRTLLPVLKETLDRVDFRQEWLELEITESYTFQNPDESIALLHQIRDLGIYLVIDDFGTGYSSLSYLKKLPVNKLKIDRAFVRDIPGSKDDVIMVRTIIAMAHSLGLEVVAEGVETEAQKDFLLQNGCTIIQGYLFARPMSAQKIGEHFPRYT